MCSVLPVTSGKALWSIICGQSVLACDEVVGEELQQAAAHLREGMSFYQPFEEADHKTWIQKCKLKKHQQEFVLRIGKLINVCSRQSWEIFQLFLQHEYRGSVSQLSAVSTNDREETALLHQVFAFYLSDPLHLLSCRRHILVCNPLHPYEELFKDFVNDELDLEGSLGPELINQLKKLCSVERTICPSPHTPTSSLPSNAASAWTSHCLAAIRHQLATLLVYYGSPGRSCSPQSVITIIELMQGGGLGWEILESMEDIDRSSYDCQLDAINAFHSFLLTLVINSDLDPSTHPLCSEEWRGKIDSLMQSLGSKQWHLPPLLTWVLLQVRYSQSKSGNASTDYSEKHGRLAQRAIRGNVFQYMQSVLNMPAFETDKILSVLAGSITYSLLCSVGAFFDLEKLNVTAHTTQLAQACLAFDPPAHMFWSEDGGGASVLLPAALDAFPHNPQPLLRMATSLASAGPESCAKVVDMLRELESFTWMLTEIDGIVVSISSNQCVTRIPLHPLPGVVIPMGCHGNILSDSSGHLPAVISWQLSTNGWQIVLSAIKSLELQVKSGVPADPWLVDTAVASLSLMATVISTNSQHSPLLLHLQEAAQLLLLSISKTLKPSYELVSALLKFFAVLAVDSPASVWHILDSCSLLSSLPMARSRKSKVVDLLLGYKAGGIRALICGEEAANGKYPILKHLSSLLESALSAGVQENKVNGSLVFVVKEVLPVMLQWRYCRASEKVEVIEGVFALLHHTLEEEFSDKGIQEFVVSELLQLHGGGGNTLRTVLESSASLEATLDQPAEWPQSSHSRRLTRVAQLALSLTHRLVGLYISNTGTDGDTGTNKRIWLSSGPPHVALTIAQFAYHRLNPRLPCLALRTLEHLAQEMSVPLVACLGTEAEGLRDCLITRLGSSTEDLWVKVSLLRLLTTSTLNQPGLIRLFLTPPATLLEPVVDLFDVHCCPKTEASMELLASLAELVASLWSRNYSTATSYLREQSCFWTSLYLCLSENSPGSIKDSLVGNILKVFSLEYFEAKEEVCVGLEKTIKLWFNDTEDHFTSWIQYIFNSSINNSKDNKFTYDRTLLSSCRDFFAVLIRRSKNILSFKQKTFVGETGIEGLLYCFESNEDGLKEPQMYLAEIHLSLLQEFGSCVVKSSKYISCSTRILSCLRSEVMQTTAITQALVLAGSLKVLANFDSKTALVDFAASIVNAAILLTEQHCSLSLSTKEEGRAGDCSSPGVLGLACALLRQCLIHLPTAKMDPIIQQSHLISALVQAATEHTQIGNNSVVKEVLRLLSLLARLYKSPELNSNVLSTSVSLVMSTQTQVDPGSLSELLWCVIWCFKRGGASDLDGAVSIAAVHLPTMTAALAVPHLQHDLAFASASLCATMEPFHQLWRVVHPRCFEGLLTATACCTHRTTKLLHLKESLEREVTGRTGSDVTGKLSSATIILMNKLLQILITCLQTLRSLSPDIVELLSCPGMDFGSSGSNLVQSTCRKLSTEHPSTLPNLATLADILDLGNVLIQKESRVQTLKSSTSPSDSEATVNVAILNQCTEEALLLLMARSALLLLNPNVQRREVREIRTFLTDETESFLSLHLGRRQPSTSPIPPPSPGLAPQNAPFFKLCSGLINSLCQSKTS